MTDKDGKTKWLIDDKFKDDDDGRAALAESYKNLQGKTQKVEDALKISVEAEKRLKPLEKLGKIVNNDEAILQFIKRRTAEGDKQTQELKEPEMPVDYDSLDIGTKGTSTYEYHQDVRKYDKAVALQEAKEGFNSELIKIRTEISDSGKQSKATEDLHKALTKNGYDEEGIVDFKEFVTDIKPEKATETLIKLHKLSIGKDVVVPLEELQRLNDKGFPLVGIVPGIIETEEKSNEAAEKEMKDAMKVG